MAALKIKRASDFGESVVAGNGKKSAFAETVRSMKPGDAIELTGRDASHRSAVLRAASAVCVGMFATRRTDGGKLVLIRRR